VPRHLGVSFGLVAALALTVAACGGAATRSPAPATASPAPAASASPAPATASPAPATAPPASAAPASVPPAGGDAVTIAGFTFDPATLTVKVGATVTWTNTDSATHTVVWDDGSPGSGSLTNGGTPYSRTFDTAGTFAYACGIHATMKGTIVVQP